MSTFCKSEDLLSESDVEQKLLLPILTSPYPLGLGYLKSDFRTKADVRKISIGKGKTQKLYYPDYMVILQGLPLFVIEAKKPGEDLEEALREARLYALALNSDFPKDINPCERVVVSDGRRILSSPWDTTLLDIDVEFQDVSPGSENYSKLVNFLSKKTIQVSCDSISKKIRGNRKFSRPNSILGGINVRNEELPENGFGSSLTLEYRHLFKPTTDEDRAEIARHMYVPSRTREKHLEPINKIILAANPPSTVDAKKIQDTENPSEIFKKLKEGSNLKSELLLLIGNVGSGKSTFIDYLREQALPPSIKENTDWIVINMNNAPVSKDLLYRWVQQKIINGFKEIYTEIDFEELQNLERLYSVELNRVIKGRASLFPKGSDKYNELLADELSKLQNDLDLTSKAFSRYLCSIKATKLLVVVLDNCDKRDKETQLLFFDVAQWLKDEYKCLVFLPMRDTTYDHHRSEPPLDTVIKDLVFRIDPPQLASVLYKRIHYAVADDNKTLSYQLPNGFVVNYKQSEQKLYLACILKSLFNGDPFFRQLVNGIAGRDLRRGIEIFLDFCKSGHIGEEEILKIRNSKGTYLLPNHLITRVLFRGSRRYYADEGTYIKNLFLSFPEEEVIPDPYIRIAILQWFKNRYRLRGPNQTLGYHKISELLKDLIPLGHSEKRIVREIGSLVRFRCLLSGLQEDEVEEDERSDSNLGESFVSSDDLISIAPSGHIHLQLLSNLDYLASCAEDVWYDEIQIAQKIADRLSGKAGIKYLSLASSVNNASDLINYLIDFQKKFISKPHVYLEKDSYENLLSLNESLRIIEKFKGENKYIVDIEQLKSDFPPGTIVEGQVVSIQKYGIFIEFGLNAVGMIHSSKFTRNSNTEEGILLGEIQKGSWIKVEIVQFAEAYGKFDLQFPTI